jgi:hypothetical protein
MPSWKTWVQRPRGVIKNGGAARTFNGYYRAKAEMVESKQIFIINLNSLSYTTPYIAILFLISYQVTILNKLQVCTIASYI